MDGPSRTHLKTEREQHSSDSPRANRSVGFLLAVLLASVMPGCAAMRGETFDPNPLASEARRYRRAEPNLELFGFSTKAQEIERNFGAR